MSPPHAAAPIRPAGSGALPGGIAIPALGAVAALGLGLAAAPLGMLVVPVAAVLIVVGWCAYAPITATYLYLATLPFIAGVERGVVPVARPNEALLLVVIAGAALGVGLRYAWGAPLALPTRSPVDVPLAAFILLATVWPITLMLLRGTAPGAADLLAVLPVVKLTVLLVLVRLTVRHAGQLLRVVRIVVWSAVAIAGIAVLQTLGVAPVIDVLARLTPSEDRAEVAERGTTTLASSIATGDYILIGLILVVMCGVRGLLGRRERLVAGFALTAGVLAAGQFSTWISGIVVACLLLGRYPVLRRRALRLLPVAALAFLIGAPAFITRLASFGEGFGVPRSWLGRWDNLSSFYLPRLAEDANFLWGVTPESVLQAPETWRELIYLESGYLLLLWVGGVPLLLGFAWLSVAVLRRARLLEARPDAVGACAGGLGLAWSLVLVISVIDPHLFLRGTGDLLFTLLAVATGALALAHTRRGAPAEGLRGP